MVLRWYASGVSDRKGAALSGGRIPGPGRKRPAQGGDTTLRIEVEGAGGPWRGGPPGDGRPHGLDDAPGIIIVRADSSYYSAAFCGAAHRDGVRFSVTVNTDPKIAAGIAAIGGNGLDGDWPPTCGLG